MRLMVTIATIKQTEMTEVPWIRQLP